MKSMRVCSPKPGHTRSAAPSRKDRMGAPRLVRATVVMGTPPGVCNKRPRDKPPRARSGKA